MMCKNCKHAFCWYCLESLDVSTACPQRGHSSELHACCPCLGRPFPKSLVMVPAGPKVFLESPRVNVVSLCHPYNTYIIFISLYFQQFLEN